MMVNHRGGSRSTRFKGPLIHVAMAVRVRRAAGVIVSVVSEPQVVTQLMGEGSNGALVGDSEGGRREAL